MRQETRDALVRAADWLEANPTKHIMVHLATDDEGKVVPPIVRRATCFCALGRLAKELNARVIEDIPWSYICEALGLTSAEAGQIWNTNDKMFDLFDADALAEIGYRDIYRRANPAVIPLMRKLAA